MLVRPVKRLLDGEHALVFRGGLNKGYNRIVGIVRMVEQDVVAPQLLKQIAGLGGQAQLPRHKGTELQIRPRRLVVNIKQPRKVHRAVNRKNLPAVKFKHCAQALDNLGIGLGLDLHAHRVSLAAVVQFRAHRFQQIARFLLLQVEVAVARDAEGGGRNDVVALIHPRGMVHDQIGKKNEIDGPLRWQADQSRQRPRDSYNSGIGKRGATATPQQEGDAQCFVDHTWKGMRRIDRHRGEQRIKFPFAVIVHKGQRRVIQFIDAEHANSLLRQLWPQALVPA